MDNFDSFNKIKDKILPNYKDMKELSEKIMLGSGLFGTILSDAYTINESKEIYKCLKVICGKYDDKPFDEYGIYCYWDYKTKEILYIGLSKNLITRFSQHNNLGSKRTRGNKSAYIRKYFMSNEKLGFSILLQPPLVKDGFKLFDKDREIQVIEGALFESFIEENGRLPKWNKIEGDKIGRKPELVKRYGDILEMLNLKKTGYLNSNSTIREVANNVQYQEFECDLNLIRSHMYQWKEPFETTLEKIIAWNNFQVSNGNLLVMSSTIRLLNLLNNPYLDKKMNAL